MTGLEKMKGGEAVRKWSFEKWMLAVGLGTLLLVFLHFWFLACTAAAGDEMVKRQQYQCTVVRVLDGDTFDGDVDLGWDLRKRIRVRMAGIDAPETKGATKSAGLVSKQWLKARIEGKEVTLVMVKIEKYGRSLCRVLVSGQDINQQMIDLKLAKPYSGGKRN